MLCTWRKRLLMMQGADRIDVGGPNRGDTDRRRGRRTFYTDQDGVVHQTWAAEPATVTARRSNSVAPSIKRTGLQLAPVHIAVHHSSLRSRPCHCLALRRPRGWPRPNRKSRTARIAQPRCAPVDGQWPDKGKPSTAQSSPRLVRQRGGATPFLP